MTGTGERTPGERGVDADRDPWRWRRAADVRPVDRLVIAGLAGAGVLSVLRFADWWFRGEHVAHPLLYVVLTAALWYGVGRILLRWFNLQGLRRPEHVPPEEGVSVAIFTTSTPGEPLAMFERTLEACSKIRYPHTTYLLDDTEDPRYREVAERHGAVWLEIVGEPGAKAGKINRALERTDEDFVLVLDPDHVPFPGFLDRVLGHFRDPDVGFVQVAQAYYNQGRSFVARAAAEQTYAFYGSTMMGLHGHGAPLAIGANCTFRREALESIGGHGVGLAEDLVTAIRLHAGGWSSVYVPEIVSRGLVPEDLGSFYGQQLKWSRGVHEVLFRELPRAFRSLTWRQRLTYVAVGTYFLVGLTTLLYLVLPYLYLWTGAQPAAMPFDEFLVRGAPVAVVGMLLYGYAQRWLCHPSVERGTHLRALTLKIACWPVHLAGAVLAVLDVDVPYVPTAKERQRGRFWRLAWPHLGVAAVWLATLSHVVYRRLAVVGEGRLLLTSEAVWGMVGFATLALLQSFGGIYGAWEARDLPDEDPWSGLAEPRGNAPRDFEPRADGGGVL